MTLDCFFKFFLETINEEMVASVQGVLMTCHFNTVSGLTILDFVKREIRIILQVFNGEVMVRTFC